MISPETTSLPPSPHAPSPTIKRLTTEKFDTCKTANVGKASGEENEREGWVPMDGNEAAATVAYACSDVSFIFPITPSSPMGELVDSWAAADRLNAFGQKMQVTEMESEAGAAGALHGALVAGALATTFTASQGLLLMIPNMYKIAGELMPCVIHVAARAVAGHALSIFGDHSDVMACRQTGWAMLASHSVQECYDLALVAHLATLESSVPFLHFFDGFRTSHEISKIRILTTTKSPPLSGLGKGGGGVEDATPAEVTAHLKREEPGATVAKVARELIDMEAVKRHHDRALNPMHPHQRGTSQGPDIYFQMAEAANRFHKAVPSIVEACFERVAQVTGRRYNLFDYVGHPEATRVVVIMGAGAPVVEEVVQHLTGKGEAVGLVKVHLFRPWSAEHLLAALPSSVQRVAVLDRTKESGSFGEPLYLDVSSTLMEEAGRKGRPPPLVIGGRFGLGSKEFDPSMALSVFENLSARKPRSHFCVGVVDDVTFTSLHVGPPLSTVPPGTTQCVFWGMGSDGTVGSNKAAVKIISDNTSLRAQAYFAYDAHKSGGVTISHLRFGPHPITCQYLVQEGQADYVAVHNPSYLHKYDFLASLKLGGTLVINGSFPEGWPANEGSNGNAWICKLRPRMYIIDARAVSEAAGLGKRINVVMQTVFFSLSGVLSMSAAIALLKDSVTKTYSKKGEAVVQMNHQCIDNALEHLVEVSIPKEWEEKEIRRDNHQGSRVKDRAEEGVGSGGRYHRKQLKASEFNTFIEGVFDPILRLEGGKLPVSAFSAGGSLPPGTTKFEKRAVAAKVPAWTDPDSCTQCNYCALVCPHAAIRPALATDQELDACAPPNFETRRAKGTGAGVAGLKYRVQVSPFDCMGCELCFQACPQDSLTMVDIDEGIERDADNWEFATESLPDRGYLFDRNTVKGSQFHKPLLEFSGACEGCGETPYVKLLTQLFGERMVIANATGCSSIWGGSAPTNPYTVDDEGRGPAWANSLFEDNAQFGLGIAMAMVQRRSGLASKLRSAVARTQDPQGDTTTSGERSTEEVGAHLGEKGSNRNGEESLLPKELLIAAEEWLGVMDGDAEVCGRAAKRLEAAMEKHMNTDSSSTWLQSLFDLRDLLPKPSTWIIGGDGWAYDIGSGGLDHVLSCGENVNVLVLDTEMYSNTGGQKSKSTPLGAVAQFAAAGKRRSKKDLGLMSIQSGDVYTASVCLGANYSQVVRAFVEAERYPGTSVIVAYSPCILQGLRGGMSSSLEESRLAVESGYWPLYRFDPSIKQDDEHARFQLDSRGTRPEKLPEFLRRENRFTLLARKRPEDAKALHLELGRQCVGRIDQLGSMATPVAQTKRKILREYRKLQAGLTHTAPLPGERDGIGPGLKENEGETPAGGDDEVLVLYGTETGNAEGLAHVLASDLSRRGVSAVRVAKADDVANVGELSQLKWVVVVISTAGQGEFPESAVQFWDSLETAKQDLKVDGEGGSNGGPLAGVHFAVFGLGDSAYCFFCKSALQVDARLSELGGTKLLPPGLGDDQDDDRFETAFARWSPDLWDAMNLPPPPREEVEWGKEPEPIYTVILGKPDAAAVKRTSFHETPSPLLLETSAIRLRLQSSLRLSGEGFGHEVLHMVVDAPAEEIILSAGDSLAVFPRNDPADAAEITEFLGLDPTATVSFSLAGSGAGAAGGGVRIGINRPKAEVPEGTTIQQLFTDVLDIFGRPSTRFYESLARFAKDPHDARRLRQLVSRTPDGREAFHVLLAESVTFADVLRRFPSARPSLAHLLDLIPAVKPRSYSIASSRRAKKNTIELCVGVVEWETSRGAARVGLCTGYLRKLHKAKESMPGGWSGGSEWMACGPRPSAGLCMPSDTRVPIVMAALGTGVAPMRALCQERQWQLIEGKHTGEMVLFFGCRHRAGPHGDYLYGDDWERYLNNGVLTKLRVAFSRDQAHKIYITDRIKEEGPLLHELLVKKKGFFFFCGSRSGVLSVRKAMEEALASAAGGSIADASVMIEAMAVRGRYVTEAWS